MSEAELYKKSIDGCVVTGFNAHYGPNWSKIVFSEPKYNNYELSAARRFINGGSVPSAFANQKWIVFDNPEIAEKFINQQAAEKSASIRADG